MGLGSGSTNTFAAATSNGVNDPEIQDKVIKLETNLESERQRRRLMELILPSFSNSIGTCLQFFYIY